MGNSSSKISGVPRSKGKGKSIIEKMKKSINRVNPENEDVFGLIDVSNFIPFMTKEEVKSRIEETHEYRRINCGKIVIDEEVPDKILDLILKLSSINREDAKEYIKFNSKFYTYYKEGGSIPRLYGVFDFGTKLKDFTAFPIVLLLDFITVKRRLHVRSEDVNQFNDAFDLYLYTLRQIDRCQNDPYIDMMDHEELRYEHKLPITKDEIHEIISFFYSILDKNHIIYYIRMNDDLNHIDLN